MDASLTSPSVYVAPGCECTLEYTLSTADEIIETTELTGPLVFRVGAGRLHPAIESCIMGLRAGDAIEKIIHHSLAFGERNHDLRMPLNRAGLHERARNLQVGDSFEGPGPDRKLHIFRVIFADAESFTIDGNHPLAGVDLHFEAKILKIAP